MQPPGDDTELCTDVLQDTLFALQSLPAGLLFASQSGVWSDVVTKTTKFLVGVVTSPLQMKCIPPTVDRELRSAELIL